MEVTLYMFLVEALWQSLLLLCVHAQFNNRPINYSAYDDMKKPQNQKVTWAVSGSCLLATLLVFLLLKLHERCTDSRNRRNSTATKPLALEVAAAIEKCPIMDYSAVKELRVGNGAEECAVCLVDFVDNDTIKMLPECQHFFHQLCIDQWLPSRMTCPICRHKLTTSDDDDGVVVDIDVPMEQQQQHGTTESTEVAATAAAAEQPETAEHETGTDNVVELVQSEVA